MLLLNRKKIVFCTRLGQAQSQEERAAIEAEMAQDSQGASILQALKGNNTNSKGGADSGAISSRARKEQRYVAIVEWK